MDIKVPRIPRSWIIQEDSVPFTLPIPSWRKRADFGLLPAAGDGSNLGITGTLGANSPNLVGTSCNNSFALEYARTQFVLPECYVAGSAIILRAHAVIINAAFVSANIDVEAYVSTKDTGTTGDLVTTVAQALSVNVWADEDFDIAGAGLVAGDLFDLKIGLLVTDNGGGMPPCQAFIGDTRMMLSIKG